MCQVPLHKSSVKLRHFERDLMSAINKQEARSGGLKSFYEFRFVQMKYFLAFT